MFNPISLWFNGHLKYTWVKDSGVEWSWVIWTRKNAMWRVDMHTNDSWSWKLKFWHMIKGYSFGKGRVQSVKKHIWYTFIVVIAKLVEFKCTLSGRQIRVIKWVNLCISSSGNKFWKALWYLLRVWDLE